MQLLCSEPKISFSISLRVKSFQNPLWHKPYGATTFLAYLQLLSLHLTKLHPHQPASVQFSLSVVSDSLQPHGLQHTRLPCTSPAPWVYSNSCPSSWWFHPTISSSVIPFSSHLRSSPASGSFQMSQFFTSRGQSIRVSALASVLPMNIQDWFPLG